ncbi:MAG: hypothetical protein ACI965_002117, partial [Paraglaciecola sp.]
HGLGDFARGGRAFTLGQLWWNLHGDFTRGFWHSHGHQYPETHTFPMTWKQIKINQTVSYQQDEY